MMDYEILYKDAYLLLCQKPQGMPSQPDPSGQLDLLTALQQQFPKAALVHRLDTPTGGVMLYSLSEQATGKLSALVQDHNLFTKEYLCVTAQPLNEPSGEMIDLLFHDKRKNKAFVVDKKRGGSKEAKLSYQTLAVNEQGNALVKVRLYTGRTHQIRVQFASRGIPLLGDGKYGSRVKMPYIALWSYRAAFTHPITKKRIEVSCMPNQDALPWSQFDLTAAERK